MTYKLIITILMVALLSITSCKSKTTTSSSSGLPSVPSAGIPTAGIPSPGSPSAGLPSGGKPSPGGNPSTPSGGASLPSSGIPSTGIPTAGLPSSGQSKGQKQGDQRGDSGAEGQQGDDGANNKAQREAAGEDLRKSGEEVAGSGTQIGDQGGSGEPDTLPPETDATGDGTVYTDGDIYSAAPDLGIETEIERAQEALEAAGDALGKAGDAVADAITDEDLAAAEAQLSDARISIIIAEQEIGALKDSPYYDDGGELAEIESALEQANGVLVVATRTVLNARTGIPDFPTKQPTQQPTGQPSGSSGSSGEVAVLESELEGSLEVFDDKMSKARGKVIATAGAPVITSPSKPVPLPGTVPSGSGQGIGTDGNSPSFPPPEVIAQAGVPEDIPSAQGDDIVAQQLREAAIAETDPALKEKLWVEYKRYKTGL